jgi:hypothetical protein
MTVNDSFLLLTVTLKDDRERFVFIINCYLKGRLYMGFQGQYRAQVCSNNFEYFRVLYLILVLYS